MAVTSVIAHVYTKNYQKDVQLLLDSTVNSMVSNIETYLEELENVSLIPYYNEEIYMYLNQLSHSSQMNIMDKIALNKMLDSNISFIRYTREDTNNIFIVKDDQCLYYTTSYMNTNNVMESYDYAATDWYQKAVAADGHPVVIGSHVPDYIKGYDTKVISVVRSIVNLTTREPICVIKMDINTAIFNRIFKDFRFHVNSQIIIQDENQNTLYSNQPLADRSSKTYTYPLKQYLWEITLHLSNKELRSKTNIIYFIAILLYILGLGLSVLSHTVLSKRIVISINSMKDIFSAMENGDFHQKYTYHSNTELDNLGSSLNHMSEELGNKIEKEYIMALKQQDIEFRALQAQIQPHFLFNTLNNFIALNQLGYREKLETSLCELSEMLRYILKAPSLIPLELELDFIHSYCSLQKLRFSDRMHYEILADSSLKQVIIPKLLLQPIVENSILHGIEPCIKPCTITISVTSISNGIQICISDDGTGFNLDTLDSNKSIGINNVQKRLQIFSPESQFTIESKLQEGTTVTIKLINITTEV